MLTNFGGGAFFLRAWLCGNVLLSVMVRDKIAESRHLLTFACNLWLDARQIKIPPNFFLRIERIKVAADKAQDEATLRKVTDQFLAITKNLAVKDWKGYENYSSSPHPPELNAKATLKHATPPNSTRAGSHAAKRPGHK
jgi:hypothetical protein